MHFLRARVVPVAVILGAGAVIGALGSLTVRFDGPFFNVVGLIFSGGWSWACFAFMVGYFRPSKVESALLASSALAVGVIIYYLVKYTIPAAPIGMTASGGPGSEAASRVLVWGMAAFAFGGPVALVGNLARAPGIAGLSFRLLVPLIAFVETSFRLDAEADLGGKVAEITWHVTRVVAVLIAVALIGHTVWRWRVRRRSLRVRAATES
ncbi:hypothetical protein ACGFYZ_02085 [Streptomyces sp. NPDC048330]|uniref:hypothetical protein n=1 Tax=Streptomyces sp. NPDC048330 TaxID=3365533 RepID=UPI00371A49BD